MDRESGTYVVAGEVVDRGLGEHGVVLELRLAERGGVASNDDELGLAGAERLEGALVSESDPVCLLLAVAVAKFRVYVLARLHHKRKARVDGVGGLLLLLLGGHLCGICSGCGR